MCFALWFTFVVTEPIPFHECAMHNPLVLMQQASAPPGNGGQAHRGQMSMMYCGDQMSHHGGGQHGRSSHHRHHQCNCLGCCAGTALTLVPRLSGIVPVPERIAEAPRAYPVVWHVVTEPDFLLPPATAPPTIG